MTWLTDNYPDSTIDDWDMPTTSDADDWLELRFGTDSAWATGASADRQAAMYRSWDYLRGLDWKDDVFDTELDDQIKQALYVGAYYEFSDAGCLQPVLSSGQ